MAAFFAIKKTSKTTKNRCQASVKPLIYQAFLAHVGLSRPAPSTARPSLHALRTSEGYYSRDSKQSQPKKWSKWAL